MTLIIELEVPDGAVQHLDAALALVNAVRVTEDPPLATFTREEYIFGIARDAVALELELERREVDSVESQDENVDILGDFDNG